MSQSKDIKRFRTIVISDVHLGSKWSSAEAATQFLRDNTCERLILCGDIIDGWAIMRGSKERWKSKHTNFIKTVLEISLTTEVIYIRGNHDDFLDRVVPIKFSNISVVTDYVLVSGDKQYFVLHGDIFDNVTTSARWLSKLGDIGYSLLLKTNRFLNYIRIKLGLELVSFASEIKQKVKSSVSRISNFEHNLAELTRLKKCQGVICGHIHRPEMKRIDEIEYLNSGDWIESNSALVEDYDGNWSLKFANPNIDNKS